MSKIDEYSSFIFEELDNLKRSMANIENNKPQKENKVNENFALSWEFKNGSFFETPYFIPKDYFLSYCYYYNPKITSEKFQIGIIINNNKPVVLIDKVTEKNQNFKENIWSLKFPVDNKSGFYFNIIGDKNIPEGTRLFIIFEKKK